MSLPASYAACRSLCPVCVPEANFGRRLDSWSPGTNEKSIVLDFWSAPKIAGTGIPRRESRSLKAYSASILLFPDIEKWTDPSPKRLRVTHLRDTQFVYRLATSFSLSTFTRKTSLTKLPIRLIDTRPVGRYLRTIFRISSISSGKRGSLLTGCSGPRDQLS